MRNSYGVTINFLAVVSVILMILPLLVVVAAAFNPERLVFPPEGFSLRWFQELAHNQLFLQSALTSVIVGLTASSLSTILGLIVAIGIRMSNSRAAGFVSSIMMSPTFIPSVLIGLALYQLSFTLLGGKPLWVLIFGHILITVPFPLRTIIASLEPLPRTLDEAAMSVGAKPGTMVRHVLVPLIKPGLFAGWMLAFIMSWNDFNVSLFLSSPGAQPLAVQIFAYINYDYKPILASMSVTLVVLAAIGMLVLNRLVGLTSLTGGRQQ